MWWALGHPSDFLAMLAKDFSFDAFSESHYIASLLCLGRWHFLVNAYHSHHLFSKLSQIHSKTHDAYSHLETTPRVGRKSHMNLKGWVWRNIWQHKSSLSLSSEVNEKESCRLLFLIFFFFLTQFYDFRSLAAELWIFGAANTES